MDDVLEAHPPQEFPVLPAQEQKKFEDAGCMYLKCQNYLALQYNAPPENLMLFDVTIKSHYMAHILLQSRDENPRSSWCYSGEHLMSKFKQLESACVNAVSTEMSSNGFTFKYACYQHFQTHEAGVSWVQTKGAW